MKTLIIIVLKYLKTYLWVLPVMTFTALGAYVLLPFVLFGILGMPDLRELKKWSEQPLTWATNIGPRASDLVVEPKKKKGQVTAVEALRDAREAKDEEHGGPGGLRGAGCGAGGD